MTAKEREEAVKQAIANEKLEGLEMDNFSRKLAYFYEQLNFIHPLEKEMVELREYSGKG